MNFINEFIHLLLDAAPLLLFGFFISALISHFIPQDTLKRHLQGRGFKPIFKAALIGAPLPLCSCSVLPVAMGLHRDGASRSSTVSFLVATPETGVDSIALSYGLLGPFYAVIRPIAAIFSAVTSGLFVTFFEKKNPLPEELNTASNRSTCGCCHSHEHDHSHSHSKKSFFIRLFKDTKSSLGDMQAWLLIGLIFAALVKTYVPNDFLTTWGSGPLAYLVMTLIGIPMYICATASTPIAAAFLVAGVSPGAILVFLLVGPASNMGSLGIIKKELGSFILKGYLLGVIVMAWLFALMVDFSTQFIDLDQYLNIISDDHITPYFISVPTTIFIVILAFYNTYEKIRNS